MAVGSMGRRVVLLSAPTTPTTRSPTTSGATRKRRERNAGCASDRGIPRRQPLQVLVGEDGLQLPAVERLEVRAGGLCQRQRRRQRPVALAVGRGQLQPGRVGRRQEDLHPVEADHLDDAPDEGPQPLLAVPRGLHRERHLVQPGEEATPLLGPPQEPALLDRQRGVVGERRQERDLLGVEPAAAGVEEAQDPDDPAVGAQRDREEPPQAPIEGDAAVGRVGDRVVAEVLDGHRHPGGDDATAQALAGLDPERCP